MTYPSGRGRPCLSCEMAPAGSDQIGTAEPLERFRLHPVPAGQDLLDRQATLRCTKASFDVTRLLSRRGAASTGTRSPWLQHDFGLQRAAELAVAVPAGARRQ